MLVYRRMVENQLDSWLDSENNQAKNIINCLVSWLAEDPYWVIENISQVDKEILKELVGKMR